VIIVSEPWHHPVPEQPLLSLAIVRATISPDQHASRSLIDRYGLTEVGEQWDDEDGRETIFEIATRTMHSSRHSISFGASFY